MTAALDVDWPLATLVIVLAFVALVLAVVAKRDSRTRRMRIGLFVERERFEEPVEWPEPDVDPPTLVDPEAWKPGGHQ